MKTSLCCAMWGLILQIKGYLGGYASRGHFIKGLVYHAKDLNTLKSMKSDWKVFLAEERYIVHFSDRKFILAFTVRNRYSNKVGYPDKTRFEKPVR